MWKKVRTNLSSREEVIPVNTFFRHFWLSKYGFTTEAKMYKKFKSSVKNGTIEAENFLKDLVTEAFNYSIVSSPLEIDWKQQEEIDIFDGLKALKIFKIKIVRTLLIALITQRTAKKIKLGDFNRVISAIEKFHFTHTAVCSERSTGLEAKYSKIARAVRDCSTKAESRIVLDDFIDYLKNKVPPYSLFKEKFKNVLYTKDKKLIQYIFTKWEQSIRQTNELTTKIITLEHIKPKSLGGKEVHQIGNLLPLDRKLNQDADTLPLHQKIIEFQKSELKVVEIFLSENNGQTTWNTSDISNRTTRIAHIAYHTIWKI